MSRIERNKGGKKVITVSIGFEIELNCQSVINIDDILMSAQNIETPTVMTKRFLLPFRKPWTPALSYVAKSG